jgi:predicted dehydrogenase
MIRVGVLGLGTISRYYLPALAAHPDCRVTAVCDLKPPKLAGFPAGVACHENYRAVLTSDDVDAVVVNLPNHLHFQVCRAALLAGKHVCCEKPLTADPGEAVELEAIAARADRTLFTAFHRRYNRNALRLAERMRARPAPARATLTYLERIEDHCGTDAWYLDPNRCGGGCVIDNGSNAFDTALQLLGPIRLRNARIDLDAAGSDRRAVIELDTHGGGTATIRLDWGYEDGEDKAVVVEWDDLPPDRADLLAGFPAFKSSLDHEYEAVVHDFVRTAAYGRPRRDTGREVAELVSAAYRLGAAA